MTQREQIKALQREIAELRNEMATLKLQVAQSGAMATVHHHHHYPVPPAVQPQPQPLPPSIAPFPWTSPNICGAGQSQSSIDPSRITVWN